MIQENHFILLKILIQIIDLFDFYFIPNNWIELNLGWLPAHKFKKIGVSQNRQWLIFVVGYFLSFSMSTTSPLSGPVA